MRLRGWQNSKTGELKVADSSWRPTVGILHPPTPQTLQPLSFSGIHAISPELFRFLPEETNVFSIIDVYLEAASTGRVLGFDHSDDAWLDVGRPESLTTAGRTNWVK
jgi:NDP-sugar pyrophosphorylase family protein